MRAVRLDERHGRGDAAEQLGVGGTRLRDRRRDRRSGAAAAAWPFPAGRPPAGLLEQAGDPGMGRDEVGIAALEERAPLRRHRLGVLEVLVEQGARVAGVQAVDVVRAHPCVVPGVPCETCLADLHKRTRACGCSLTVMGPIEQLYRERNVGFRNALAPIVGSRELARDVVQEAFATALREQRRLRHMESLAPWVWKTAYRIALRERRHANATELPADQAIIDVERDPALAAAIRTLPPQRRLILFLRYFADFSYAEIAEALDISEGTVAATLTQARTALLEELAPKEASG